MIRACQIGSKNSVITDILSQVSDIQLSEIASAEPALLSASQGEIDLAVVGETVDELTCFEFVEKLVSTNPFVNTVMVSDMDEVMFHEESEGLGVLGQIDPNPSPDDVHEILNTLRSIMGQIK